MKTVVNDTQVGFVQGTVVLMADGKLKPIEKIVPGDWVMSFDQQDAASELEPMEVIDTFSYITRDIIQVKTDDSAVMVARGQLFLTPSADWHNAIDTAYVTDAEGNAKAFTVEKTTAGKYKVYDIMVDDHHSLVANGFRVHNINLGGGNVSVGKDGVSVKGPGGTSVTAGPGGISAKGPGGAGLNKGAGTSNSSRSSSGNNRGGGLGNGSSTGRAGGGAGGQNNGVSKVGNGQNSQYLKNNNSQKSLKKTKGDGKTKKEPAPTPEAMAYAAFQALQQNLDYICDIMANYTSTNYFTIRTAALEYLRYSDQLTADSYARVSASKKISKFDKSTLQIYNTEILQMIAYIRSIYSSITDYTTSGGPTALVINACSQVRVPIDRSKGVIGKYVGTGKSTIDYTLPGMPAPINLPAPVTPQSPLYVQTAPGQYVTTTTSSIGTTTTPALTGGLGAAYYRYRTVRGFLYGYNKNSGWVKVGPADQWEGLY